MLHGPVGTGKTHLLEGIYAGLRRAHADWRVLYVTTEDFTNRFVQAMRLGKLGAFRKHFRECDALLVDDLHFLAGKKATQEEFLHTFDALLADGRQMVLTCDCHPRLADDFTPELTDRLLGGAVWGLTPPDADVRLAVLRAKAVAGREAAPSPTRCCASWPASCAATSASWRGRLHSVRHYARVTGRPIERGAGARGAGRPAASRGARGAAGGRGPGGACGAAPGGRRLAEQGPRLGGQPPAHGRHLPGAQAHRVVLRRDRRLVRRPQPQHRRRRREEGAPVAARRRGTGPRRTARPRPRSRRAGGAGAAADSPLSMSWTVLRTAGLTADRTGYDSGRNFAASTARTCQASLRSGCGRPFFSHFDRPIHPILVVPDAALPSRDKPASCVSRRVQRSGEDRAAGRPAFLTILPRIPRPTLGKESR